MTFLINAIRAILFGLHRSLFSIRPKALEQVLMDLPGLLFFSTFTLLVLFWAEIYNQICIWVYMSISKTAAGAESAILFLAVISFCAALGFLIYGGRLFILLLRFPIESRGRVNNLYEVGSVTCICCTCFLIRCVMLALSALNKGADLDVLQHPTLNLVYYMLVGALHSEKGAFQTDNGSLPLSTHRHMTSQCLPSRRFSPLFFSTRTLPSFLF